MKKSSLICGLHTISHDPLIIRQWLTIVGPPCIHHS